jgi:hypothetical protein
MHTATRPHGEGGARRGASDAPVQLAQQVLVRLEELLRRLLVLARVTVAR